MRKITKLLVGTPAYNSMVHTDYLHSVMSYTTVKDLSFSVATIGNESLITRARNKIFSIFANNKAFDYLLFLDADIMFPVTELTKLLSHNKDLIGAPVRLKDSDRIFYNYGEVLDESMSPLLEVDRIGNAVMLISRKLANDVVDKCIDSKQYYIHNPDYTRGNQVLNNKIYDVFKVGIHEGEYLSEDYWFCKFAAELGYAIYVDTSCKTVHNGVVSLA
ncbi:MAG: hypothetical protein DRQ78_11035 [Epsilonproteobacteria bacterium]|nr:MAG: hypothetical protein DRQ78_11035 [Campylobacterota bacterium]